MINATLTNLSLKTFDIGNPIIKWNKLYVNWIFSYTTNILFAIVIGLIIWNIWLSYKMNKLKNKQEE